MGRKSRFRKALDEMSDDLVDSEDCALTGSSVCVSQPDDWLHTSSSVIGWPSSREVFSSGDLAACATCT